MRLVICAVGRLRAGPERALTEEYLGRFAKTGRGLGLAGADVAEVDAKGAGQAAEHELLARACPAGAARVVLDERGRQITSPDLADRLARWRDEARDVAFVIGGADGVTEEMRGGADLLLSFGPMVWPHALARVMLAEQLYRAATILAGTPYHRV
ncbi:23S rRNA (pseudouridine(1915)-N(3))-methyltransferase RlmH [Pseudoroseicyclus tamaricis]|uniref:Ribosomal RNA large subunit methyltransferase H n=1 Tax=Pseudoroseicyclus tamaricis TaxID=2705421 RepID=A0A6B2K0X0_9RHOB|nr:23S rRNA (pseudouridine(1915)-N(3))-methyltransferase RlmH [Pseudoroseicyclus tamaricis]NDV02084.1 23S rRNA (pseudouridine(1915)-N(3))-methyltransferase RlmH [Pseudoroseicyclus tamaricis]